jgi:hypothetical protein
MKKRTAVYFQKTKAMKVLTHVTDVDLGTFLKATFQLAKSNVVKRHIQLTMDTMPLNAA